MFRIKQSFKTGLSFGFTSGIITTLGLMVGLQSGTHSKFVVLGGILVIAISDAMSDSLGIHISEESRKASMQREIWESTVSTFLAKFIIAVLFVIPILLFSLSAAVIVNIIFGLFLVALLSFSLARLKQISPYRIVAEHVFITVLVIVATHFVGSWVTRLSA